MKQRTFIYNSFLNSYFCRDVFLHLTVVSFPYMEIFRVIRLSDCTVTFLMLHIVYSTTVEFKCMYGSISKAKPICLEVYVVFCQYVFWVPNAYSSNGFRGL